MEAELVTTKEDPFVNIMKSLAENPNVDVEKLKQIMEMQEHILDRNAKQEFNAAMVAAQRDMPIVPEDRKNSQTSSTYSAYKTIIKYCKPIYTAAGLSLLFYEGKADNENDIRVCVDIMHASGHTEKRHADIPLDNTGIKGSVNKTNTHAKGSSLSYGKTYLIKMIFNIPTGDDNDGNGAGTPLITEDQVTMIKNIIKKAGADEKRVLEYVKKRTGADNFETIPAKLFDSIMTAIRQKIKEA